MRRLAATLGSSVLLVGGLATAVIHLGPTLWDLSAPADRLGALVAEAERELAQRRPPEGATGADGVLALTGSSSPTSAGDDPRRAPFARVGARISMAVPPAASAPPGEAAVSSEGEPASTVDVVRGQTVYRMNGDLILDPGQPREDLVEAGYEYQFNKRGLEKVKLWEVRR
jgi:hypothetical protein